MKGNKKMKIGVITTQYSPNFGALLQTFALQRYLLSIESVDDVEVIDYFPEHAKSFWKVYSDKKDIKDRLLNAYVFLHRNNVRAKKKQFEIFRNFITDNIKCSKRLSATDISTTREMYDAFICGSDQIWNMTRHDDPIWFLYFTKGWDEKIKIAYAPSIADEIPPRFYEHIKEYVENLDMVSVREDVDVEQLRKITDKEVFHACDPVFLLSPDEWSSIIQTVDIKQPYIFCYFISTGDYAVSVVKKLKEVTGLNVLHVNVNARDRFDSKWDIRNCTPFEFISYIKNATYVCTNSFHCTAFSLLFKKDFIVVPKKTANSRMKSLMDKVSISDRFIYPDKLSSLSRDGLTVDYSESNLDEWITESKKFICKGLRLNEYDR